MAVQEAALNALHAWVCEPSAAAIRAAVAAVPGCLAALAQVLHSSITVSVKARTAGVLSWLAAGSAAAIAAQPGCIEGLVQLVSSDIAEAHKAAAGALYSLVGATPASRDTIRPVPGTGWLVPVSRVMAQALNSNSTVDVKGRAALVLAYLAADNAAAAAIATQPECVTG